jgi:hypothetical protein
MVNTRNN